MDSDYLANNHNWGTFFSALSQDEDAPTPTQELVTRSIFDTQQQSCERKRWSDLVPDTQGIGGAIYSTPKSSNVFPCSNTQSKRPRDVFPCSNTQSPVVMPTVQDEWAEALVFSILKELETQPWLRERKFQPWKRFNTQQYRRPRIQYSTITPARNVQQRQ